MKAKAKRSLQGLLLALLVAGAGMLAYPAHTEAAETGGWREVCCGNNGQCGEDHCLGNGEYICCK